MTKTAATRWSWRVMAVVGLLGLVLVVVPAVFHLGRVVREDPFVERSQTKTVTTKDAAGKVTSTETTVSPGEVSLIEQSLAAGGLLLLRLGIVAITTFLAGALTQRTLLGQYRIKVGPLEVGDIVGDTAESITKVTRQLSSQRTQIKNVAQESADAIDRLSVALQAGHDAQKRLNDQRAAFEAALDRRLQAVEGEPSTKPRRTR